MHTGDSREILSCGNTRFPYIAGFCKPYFGPRSTCVRMPPLVRPVPEVEHVCEIKHVDFYASDWNDGTCDLTLEERGLYITAIAQIYSRGGPVERDRLKRACGVHGRTFNAILGRLLALGKLTECDGKISQKRAEKELKNARNRVKKWLKNLENPEKSDTWFGRAGGNARTYPPTTNHQEDTSEAYASEGAADATPPDPSPPDAQIEVQEDAALPAVIKPVDLVRHLWDRGKAQLGQKSGSLIGKMRAEYGDVAVLEAIVACEDEAPSNPPAFFVKVLQTRRAGAAGRGRRSGQMLLLEAFDEITRH